MTPAINLEKSGKKRPLVSVCIVTYNQRDFIRDAVMSVIAQRTPSLFDLEVLIGDDASTDGTPIILRDLAAQYPETVFVTRRQTNVGATENYRGLIHRAKGDFVAHLDGDDFWLPGKLVTQLVFLEKYPQCLAVYAAAIVVDPQMHLVGSFTTNQPAVFGLDRLLSEGNFLCHSTLLYRASAIKSVLTLPSPFLDFEIHLLLAANNPLGFISQQLAIYRRLVIGSVTRERRDLIDQLYFTALKTYLPLVSQSIRAQGIAHYAVNIAAAYPSKILKNTFWKNIDELKNEANVPAHAVVERSARVFSQLLKRKLSKLLANLLNSNGSFIVLYPTR